jgi:hypothetical protein
MEWLRLQNLRTARAVNPLVVAAPAAASAIVSRQIGRGGKGHRRSFSWHFAVCSRDPESQFSTLGIPLGLAREPRRARLQFVVANAARERTDGALVESPRGFLLRSSFMRSAIAASPFILCQVSKRVRLPRAGEIAAAAKKFLATLDDDPRGKVVFDFTSHCLDVADQRRPHLRPAYA